ncbi:MAG: Coq4 family protein, partial [Cyanobacteriota bacterium]|nr:Coq4 family protein [Cyanobacteriota bacterium]
YATRFWLGLIVKNLLKSTIDDIEASTKYMDAITKGWLMGKQAKPLFGINWNQLWEHPLEEVRADLNIVFPNI